METLFLKRFCNVVLSQNILTNRLIRDKKEDGANRYIWMIDRYREIINDR